MVEIVIVLAMVGILAAIATVSYQQYVRKVARSDAKAELMELAQGLERCFTVNNAYNAADCEVEPHTTEGGHYAVTITNLGTNTYTLVATATSKVQLQDADCAVLRIDQRGSRTSENSTGGATTECW